MRPFALLVLAALLLSGCSSAPRASYPSGALEVEVNVLPLSDHLLFRTSTYDTMTTPVGNATVRVEVQFAAPARNVPSTPLDANQTTIQLGARQIVNADLYTRFVGVGDYWWNVTVRDAQGVLAGNASGRYETCLC